MVDRQCEAGHTEIVQRMAACVSYDGQHYHGWQKLKNDLPTVQGCVEKALSKVADHRVEVVCAGRTDAGVHATGQVIHFDSSSTRTNSNWLQGANCYLPKDIAIQWVCPVTAGFHARYSATSRRYLYIIYNHVIREGYINKKTTQYYNPLEVNKMQEASMYLVGEHDFNAYRTVHCQAKHALRCIHNIHVKRQGKLVLIDIQANAFLHHMVRNIAGVLMTIGSGEQAPLWAEQILESRDRRLGGITAPPDGLYLTSVTYKKDFQIPEEIFWPLFVSAIS